MAREPVDPEQASRMAFAAREGVPLSPSAHEQASDDFVACFSTEAGQRVLAHLKRITTGRILGPEDTDAALRDLEGRRALVAIMDMRIADGRERRKRAAAGRRGSSSGKPAA
jgi:hypothetical protein